MTEGVVDLLEAVQIQEKHPHLPRSERRMSKRCLQFACEHDPVGQSRETVVQRLVGGLLFGSDLGRGVSESNEDVIAW